MRFKTATTINLGTIGNGTLTVDGIGSSVVPGATATASAFGSGGNVAMATFRNLGSGNFAGGLNLADNTTTGTTAVVNVESGGSLTTGALKLATLGGTVAATLNVTDRDSKVTATGLTIGFNGSGGPAVINARDNGLLTVSGTTTLEDTGTINVDGGNVQLASLSQNGGKVNLNSGSFGFTGNLTVGSGGLLGSNLVLGSNRKLNINGTTTINSGSQLLIESLDGFTTSTLTNNGELALNGVSATANAPTVTNAGLIRGDGRVIGNVTTSSTGEIRAEAGKRIKLQGTAGTNSGKINLQGGTAEFSSALTNGSAGQIVGRGTLITSSTGLNNTGHIAFSSGTTDVFGDVTNNTGNSSLGITISGNSDVTFWDDVTQTTGLFKVSAGSSVTFFNAYNGTGMTGTGTKYFEYDISPGFSPATVTMEGDVYLSSTATLNIELGGTTPGSGYDQFHVGGQLTLSGTLDVTLINSFEPAATNQFDILDWGTRSGTFDAVNLPAISDTYLYWDSTQLYVDGTLLTRVYGDFDSDGDVDGADYVVWSTHFPTASGATLATGDADWDGDVDGADYVVWSTHFPYTPGSPVSAVPEPEAFALMAIALPALAVFARRRKA